MLLWWAPQIGNVKLRFVQSQTSGMLPGRNIFADPDVRTAAAMLSATVSAGAQDMRQLPSSTYKRKLRRIKQLAWEKLHCGNWRTVPVAWRHLYALCTRLEVWASRETAPFSVLMQQLDLALVLGHPRDASCCQQLLQSLSPHEQRSSCSHRLPAVCTHRDLDCTPDALDTAHQTRVPVLTEMPSPHSFHASFIQPKLPCVVQGVTAEWPALQTVASSGGKSSGATCKWHALSFWQGVLGHRHVPLELGASFSRRIF